MCELLGLSYAKPISPAFALRQFGPRCERNPHGWGLAWYPDRALALVKEPVKWTDSKLSGFLATYAGLQAPIYVGHLREKSTGGTPTFADTHPFKREWAGRDYCFAHNGTLHRVTDLPLGRFQPVGQTDSEHAFCHLLEAVANRGTHLDAEADWIWLHGQLSAINALGKLNCLLSDGLRLFAYHDQAGWKGLAHRKALAAPGRSGFLVSSRPLGTGRWCSFQFGELAVFERGKLLFSHSRVASCRSC